MLTLDALTEAVLHHVGPDDAEDRADADGMVDARPIEHVEICSADWRFDPRVQPVRDALAIIPETGQHLADPWSAIRALADAGVVALALAAPPDHPRWDTGRVRAAAEGTGVCVLEPAGPCDVRDLHTAVLRRQIDALRVAADRRDRILRLAAWLERRGEGPGRLLRELEADYQATLTVLAPGDDAWRRLGEHEHVLERISSGLIDSAAVSGNGQHVLLHALSGGTARKRQVLAAVREEPWPRPLKVLVTQVAGQVGLLQHPVRRRSEERRLHRSEMTIRVAILQHLMTGVVSAAARALAAFPTYRSMLDGDAGRVAVVECTAYENREAAAARCEALLGSRALVVLCPAEDRHIILILPHSATEPVISRLQPILHDAGGRTIGVSTATAWARTAHAYDAAFRALAAARRSSARIATHDAGTPLAGVLLDRDRRPSAAHRAARAWISRLHGELPEDHREQTLHTARVALAYGAETAGRLTGVDTSTAGRRLNHVMRALGLDRGIVGHRALADLCFQLADVAGDGPAVGYACEQVGLADWLRRNPKAVQWAGQFLEPLSARERRLLTVWVRENTVIQRAAHEMGIHRNRMSDQLDRAAGVLSRPLRQSGNGVHDLLWALLIRGDLPSGTVPDRAVGRTEPVRQ